jgi:homoserine O-acetyltransferase
MQPFHLPIRLRNPLAALVRRVAAALLCGFVGLACAAGYPKPVEGDWVVRDFRFHDGSTLPELRLHYVTIGAPSGEPVLVLHGTAGSGAGMLTPEFAGDLFGPGQPLDANRYFIVMPDAIGTGRSSKPSDGLRAAFPAYDYDDMVSAQYRLLTEHLGIRHLRLVLGNSMGGMQAWLWGEQHPGFSDALVPMGSLPTAMSSRNWMMRRMLVDGIRNDPDWNGGNYTRTPRNLATVLTWFNVVSSGGSQAWFKLAPTRERADQWIDQRLRQPVTADANDLLFQWESSKNFDPAPGLDRIQVPWLAINAADDERNPPDLGVLEAALVKSPHGRVLLIPASEQTRGHGTTAMARFYARELGTFMRDTAAPSTIRP